MTLKLNKHQVAKVQSIDAALKEALATINRLHEELTPSGGLVWNPSFKVALQAEQIVIRQMQRMNSAIEKLKKQVKP